MVSNVGQAVIPAIHAEEPEIPGGGSIHWDFGALMVD